MQVISKICLENEEIETFKKMFEVLNDLVGIFVDGEMDDNRLETLVDDARQGLILLCEHLPDIIEQWDNWLM